MFIFARLEDKQLRQPPDNTVKITVDAAYLPSTRVMTTGAVACDHNGSIIAALSQAASFCQDAEEAEGRASIASLQLGIDLEFHLTRHWNSLCH